MNDQKMIADLLRSRLACKLTEADLTTLINEIIALINDDRVDKLKSSLDYIAYKCGQIEKSLRASDRRLRPSRDFFRDRSPLH